MDGEREPDSLPVWGFIPEEAFDDRLAEAQHQYDMLGDHALIPDDLLPFINRTEKNVVLFSDEFTDFPHADK